MCDPVTLGIATTAAAAGGALSAYGTYQAGQASEAGAKANAQMMDYQAKDEERRGAIEEQRLRQQVKSFQGRQRAIAGGSGTVSNSGSALQLLSQTAEQGELDALTVRNNAYRSAWGLRSGAAVTRAEGRNARRAATLNAAGSLLTSGAGAYGIYNSGG